MHTVEGLQFRSGARTLLEMTAQARWLDRYFDRIGYGGPALPTLEVLQAISAAHADAIPFENLDVLLGRPIELTRDALVDKLVLGRRGGYCFEQNGLLLEVLETIGFTVRPLSARVRYQQPRDVTPARTHLFLQVDLEGEPWVADVGFGGFSLGAPIRLVTGAVQDTPHDQRRLVAESGRVFHQMCIGDAWHDLNEFTGDEMPLIDRVVANWYTSAHPASSFRQRLVAARTLPDGRRVTLLNRELTRRRPGGDAGSTTIDSPAHLLDVLANEFGLHFPAGTTFSCAGLDWPT
jgi:N-hydroxyarylamine O-acetyltransferase